MSDCLNYTWMQSIMVEYWRSSYSDNYKLTSPFFSLLFSFLYSFQNQFFISGLAKDDIIQNRVLEALYRRILQAHKEQNDFRVIIVMPLLPGFQVNVTHILFIISILLSLGLYILPFWIITNRVVWMMVVLQLWEL